MKNQKITLVLTISLVILMGGVALGWDWLRMGGYPYNGSMETAIKVISQQDPIFAAAAGSLKVEILDGSSWQEVLVKVGDAFKGCLFGDTNDIQVRKDVVCVWDKTSPLPGNPKPPYKALKVVTEVEYHGKYYRVALYWFKDFCGNFCWNWIEIEKPQKSTPVPGGPTPTPTRLVTVEPTPTNTPVKKTKKANLVNLQGVNGKLVGEQDGMVTQETLGGVVLTWGHVDTQSESKATPTCDPTQNPTCGPTIIPTTPETPIPTQPPAPTATPYVPSTPIPTLPPVPTPTPYIPMTPFPTCQPWPTAQPTLAF